jgi:hypothetical protein
MSVPLEPRIEPGAKAEAKLKEAELDGGLGRGRLLIQGRIFVVSRLYTRADSSADFYQGHATNLCQKNFQQQMTTASETYSIPVICRVLGKPQEHPSPKIQVIKIFTKDSDRGTVINFDPEKFSAEAIEKLKELLKNNKHFLMTHHYDQPVAKKQKLEDEIDPTTTFTDKKLTQTLKKCIRDAGSAGNKCLALSMAKNEIENSGDIQKLCEKYQLSDDLAEQLKNKKKNEQIKLLAKALIEKASDNILNDDKFLTDTDDENRPLLATEASFTCLASALIDASILKSGDKPGGNGVTQTFMEAEYLPEGINLRGLEEKKNIKLERETLRKDYCNVIKKNGEMLDLPFIVALNPPFIVIQKNNGGFEITAINDKVTLDSDPNEINNLYYNGINHYQSIVLGARGKPAIQQMLLIENKKRIQYFEEIDPLKDLKGYKEAMRHLIKFNPAYKATIIEKIRSHGKSVTDLTDNLKDSLFVEKAANFL